MRAVEIGRQGISNSLLSAIILVPFLAIFVAAIGVEGVNPVCVVFCTHDPLYLRAFYALGWTFGLLLAVAVFDSLCLTIAGLFVYHR
jgi:hypothetical protein